MRKEDSPTPSLTHYYQQMQQQQQQQKQKYCFWFPLVAFYQVECSFQVYVVPVFVLGRISNTWISSSADCSGKLSTRQLDFDFVNELRITVMPHFHKETPTITVLYKLYVQSIHSHTKGRNSSTVTVVATSTSHFND